MKGIIGRECILPPCKALKSGTPPTRKPEEPIFYLAHCGSYKSQHWFSQILYDHYLGVMIRVRADESQGLMNNAVSDTPLVVQIQRHSLTLCKKVAHSGEAAP